MPQQENEVVIRIDEQRMVSVTPTDDGQNLLLTCEDPHAITIVEMERGDVQGLYEALEDWLKR